MTLFKTASPKRFYQSATAGDAEAGGYRVRLDGRTVKTPAGRPLSVPTRALAEAIASEWNAQGETIVPASLPLTKLANTAIDGVANRESATADEILKYAASDLLCYRAPYPAELAEAQAAAWDPILAMIQAKYNAPFVTATGIAHVAQPAASLMALRSALASLGAFKLTALHVMTSLTGSALIALAHAEAGLDAETAWAAARTDETWQKLRWGEDFEAAQREKAQQKEFMAASLFCRIA